MKKMTSALAVGTIILCLFSTDESHVEENFPPAFQPPEEFKVLVKFRSGQ